MVIHTIAPFRQIDEHEWPGVSGDFVGEHLTWFTSVWRALGPFKPQGFLHEPSRLEDLPVWPRVTCGFEGEVRTMVYISVA